MLWLFAPHKSSPSSFLSPPSFFLPSLRLSSFVFGFVHWCFSNGVRLLFSARVGSPMHPPACSDQHCEEGALCVSSSQCPRSSASPFPSASGYGPCLCEDWLALLREHADLISPSGPQGMYDPCVRPVRWSSLWLPCREKRSAAGPVSSVG